MLAAEVPDLETEGFNVIPTARAANLTMNREGIRRLASEKLGLKTSRFRFVSNKDDYEIAVRDIGIPCVVKPVMSSSGKGQSTVKEEGEKLLAWEYALSGARGDAEKIIVEEFVDFDSLLQI